MTESPAQVLHLDGRPINFNRPPRRTSMVKWSKKTMGGKTIHGSFFAICAYDRLNNAAIKKYGVGIVVIQPTFNTTVPASAGTHNLDFCGDVYIPGVSWWETQRFLRAHGFACWYRHPPLFGNHVHGFPLPPQAAGADRSHDFAAHGFKVGIYVDGGVSTEGKLVTSSQIADYYKHAFGLAGQHTPNSDKSWFPRDIKATIFSLHDYVARRAA